MTASLLSLFVQQTKAEIYEYALSVATAIGLPVTTWTAGDPTRSLFHIESEMLAALEASVIGYAQSGFLDYATGDWLTILAQQVYGVTVPSATFATTDVVLTNPGGGLYSDIVAGDLTFKNTTTGKTYTNTTGGTLASGPGTTLTVTVVADEAGSDSSAGIGEIDDLITPLGSTTCSNPAAAVGVDAQDEETTRVQCRERLGRLSPNGPREAYNDVARDPALTGTTAITRVRSYGDSTTGDVTVYLAGANGAVVEADRALVEAAILEWATPLCITPTVLSCTSVAVPVTYSMSLYKSSNETATTAAAKVATALEQMFAARPIGGDIIAPATTGYLYRSLIQSTIQSVFPQAFNVSVTAPSGDTSLTNGQVAAIGTVTPSITLVANP